jgi:hypothetical protein
MMTANRARSIRRRRSNKLGKNDPERSLGIFSSTSPALVVSVRSRWPLRRLVRSGVRWWGWASITVVASASMSSWSLQEVL